MHVNANLSLRLFRVPICMRHFKVCGPILFQKFRYVWLHIYE